MSTYPLYSLTDDVDTRYANVRVGEGYPTAQCRVCDRIEFKNRFNHFRSSRQPDHQAECKRGEVDAAIMEMRAWVSSAYRRGWSIRA